MDDRESSKNTWRLGQAYDAGRDAYWKRALNLDLYLAALFVAIAAWGYARSGWEEAILPMAIAFLCLVLWFAVRGRRKESA